MIVILVIIWIIIIMSVLECYLLFASGKSGANLAGKLPKMVPVSLVIAPKWFVASWNQDAPWKPKPHQDMLGFGAITGVWMVHSFVDPSAVCHVLLHLFSRDFCKQLQCISLDWPLESAHPDAPYQINHSAGIHQKQWLLGFGWLVGLVKHANCNNS